MPIDTKVKYRKWLQADCLPDIPFTKGSRSYRLSLPPLYESRKWTAQFHFGELDNNGNEIYQKVIDSRRSKKAKSITGMPSSSSSHYSSSSSSHYSSSSSSHYSSSSSSHYSSSSSHYSSNSRSSSSSFSQKDMKPVELSRQTTNDLSEPKTSTQKDIRPVELSRQSTNDLSDPKQKEKNVPQNSSLTLVAYSSSLDVSRLSFSSPYAVTLPQFPLPSSVTKQESNVTKQESNATKQELNVMKQQENNNKKLFDRFKGLLKTKGLKESSPAS